MHVDHLREFVVCAQAGSFTRAATQTHVTQPVLSKHIAALERRLGIRLFVRSVPLELTPAGRYLYDRLEPLLTELDDVLSTTQAMATGEAGILGLGVLYYTKQIIMPTVATFSERYPNVELRFLAATPNEIVDSVLDRRMDVACVQRTEIPGMDVLEFRDLFTEPYVVAVSAGHRLAGRDAVSIRELVSESYVVINDPFYRAVRRQLDRVLDDHGVSWTPSVQADNFEDFLLAVGLGQGFGLVSQALEKLELGLAYVRLEEDLCFSRCVLYRRDNPNPALRGFLACLDEPRP